MVVVDVTHVRLVWDGAPRVVCVQDDRRTRKRHCVSINPRRQFFCATGARHQPSHGPVRSSHGHVRSMYIRGSNLRFSLTGLDGPGAKETRNTDRPWKRFSGLGSRRKWEQNVQCCQPDLILLIPEPQTSGKRWNVSRTSPTKSANPRFDRKFNVDRVGDSDPARARDRRRR